METLAKNRLNNLLSTFSVTNGKRQKIKNVMQVKKAAVRWCFSKWVFLKMLQYSQKNICAEVSFSILQAYNFIKRDCNTGGFL